MSFYEKFESGLPTLSFEFFPPKDADGWGLLYSALGSITRCLPDYVTVTYGAGGSTRQKTIDLVTRIQNELDIEAVAHLTCVGHSRGELLDILATLQTSGVRSIMALRGDAPRGEARFTPHADGFAHASDLIALIKSEFRLHVGCSYYPDVHPEAESLQKDIEYLKMKQDLGAEFAVSQFFFDNAAFFRFRDEAAAAGVTLPLVAGILPVTSLAQIADEGICRRSGALVPDKLKEFLGSGSRAEIVDRGMQFAVDQCRDLLENGVAGVHLYTLNRSTSSLRVTDALRKAGYFAPTKG
jgi:methylenetetrahydrofolate reductase (NADPH)